MITSLKNRNIKNVVQLNQKAKTRKEQNAFTIEGTKMFLEAPIEKIRQIYIAESLFSAKDHTIEEKLKKIEINQPEIIYEVVTDEIFAKMSDTKTPQGILCVMEKFTYDLQDIFKKQTENPAYLLLENLQDPGNLGTILRTAEGAGITAVIMSRDTVDIYNPKTIRSTMGSLYRLPFLCIDNMEVTIKNMQKSGVSIYAAHLKGTYFYDEVQYNKPIAFLIGNEGNGLQKETAELADAYLKIPMQGKVESLNVAVASSILMYERMRQQRNLKR